MLSCVVLVPSSTLPDRLVLDHLFLLHGPWCFLLRLATLHPSQSVRIFLRSAWFECLNSCPCLVTILDVSLIHWSLRRLAVPGCASSTLTVLQRPLIPPRAARAGRCLQSSTALVSFMSLDQARQCSFIVGSHQDSLEPLLKAAFLSVAFSLPPVPLCGSLPLRGLLWHLQHHNEVLCYCVIVGSRWMLSYSTVG